MTTPSIPDDPRDTRSGEPKLSHQAWDDAYRRRADHYGRIPYRQYIQMCYAAYRRSVADARHDPELFKAPPAWGGLRKDNFIPDGALTAATATTIP